MAMTAHSLTRLFAATAAAALSACSGGEQGVIQAQTGEPVIVLSEGPCDQTCPVYDMTLRADGSYILNGERFVKQAGLSDGQLGTAAWEAAEKVLEQAGFWSLPPEQTESNQPTCQPGTPAVAITWRTAEGKQKTLNYRVGCGQPEVRRLVADLRAALAFDRLVWTDDRFAPDGSR